MSFHPFSVRAAFAALSSLSLVVLLALPGCSSASGGGPKKNTGGTGGTGGTSGSGGGGTGGVGAGGGICLLNNCNSDAECETCTFGRNKCKLDENRCIACDPVTGQGCLAGEECTSFGTCAPVGATCPTDGSGEPTVTCASNKDCVACDPAHQICDTSTGKCTACTEQDKAFCLGSEFCNPQGKCEQKCPQTCSTDTDCTQCNLGGKNATVCDKHACVECSDAKPCLPGFECQKGQCVKPCGQPGSPTAAGADCKTDAECYGCGNFESTQKYTCKYPVNGGTHGTCTVPAQGCTDLGGVALPAPYGSVTNLCSTDANCAGVTADVNVGKLLKDLLGSDEINLGIKKIKLNDAVLKYPMTKCASITLIDDKKCGLCVPCKTDADCKPIPLDPLINDLFAGDPLAQIAAAFLMDKLFGKGQKHELHMQCQNVAKGYGVCLPCANPTKGCGAGSGTQNPSTKCDHDVCTEGGPLSPTCSICTAGICLADPYCCSQGWDLLCTTVAKKLCTEPCVGTNDNCAHGPCEEGTAMSRMCNACTKAVCDKDPYCCNLENGSWDSLCTDVAKQSTECFNQCATGKCDHSACVVGTPLKGNFGVGCDTCSGAVCSVKKSCCETTWDSSCVAEAAKQTACNCN